MRQLMKLMLGISVLLGMLLPNFSIAHGKIEGGKCVLDQAASDSWNAQNNAPGTVHSKHCRTGGNSSSHPSTQNPDAWYNCIVTGCDMTGNTRPSTSPPTPAPTVKPVAVVPTPMPNTTLAGIVNSDSTNFFDMVEIDKGNIEEFEPIAEDYFDETEVFDKEATDEQALIAEKKDCTNDPVSLASGCKRAFKSDLDYASNTYSFDIKRSFSSEFQSDWSIGAGWALNLDSRVIVGVNMYDWYKTPSTNYEVIKSGYNRILEELVIEKANIEDNYVCGGVIDTGSEILAERSFLNIEHITKSFGSYKKHSKEGDCRGEIDSNDCAVPPETPTPTTALPLLPEPTAIPACYITIDGTQTYVSISALATNQTSSIALIDKEIGIIKGKLEELETQNKPIKTAEQLTDGIAAHNKNLAVVDQNYLIEEQIGLQRIKWVDPQGNRVLFTYNDLIDEYESEREHSHQLVVNSNGSYTVTSVDNMVYNYAANGLLASSYDRFGHGYVVNRKSNHQITTVVDTKNRQLTFSYYAHGNIHTITDPVSRSIKYEYNTFQKNVNDESVTVYRLKKATGFDGTIEEYEYNDARDPLAITKKINGDIDGDGTDEFSEYIYKLQDEKLVVDKQFDPARYYWSYDYDFTGNDPLGKNTIVYDRREEDDNTSITYLKYFYDDLNRTEERYISWKDASVQYEYAEDGSGTIKKTFNELLQATEFDHNARGQVNYVKDAAGKEVSSTKGAWGELLTQTDAGGTTTFVRDDQGQIDRIELPDGTEIDETWENGLIKQRISQKKTDSNGVEQGGFVTTWSYDDYGYVEEIKHFETIADVETDKFQQFEIFDYDKIGRLLSHRIFNDYAPRGGLLFDTTRYTYVDELGRSLMQPVTITDALSRTATYKYDAQLNVKQVIDFNNVVTDFTYTARGEVETKTVTMPNPIADGYVVYEYSYDYDAEGNLDTARLPGDIIWKYDYNGDDQLTEAYIEGTNTKTTYHYDLAGRKEWEQQAGDMGRKDWSYYPNGQVHVFNNELGANIVNHYDDRGDLDTVYNSVIGVNTIDFDRDELGRVTGYTDGEANEFTFDLDSRGLKEDNYQPNSSELMIDRTLNHRGQMLTENDAEGGLSTYTYNKKGKLERVVDQNNGTWIYGYDAINRIKTISAPSGLLTQWDYDQQDNYLEVTRTRTDTLADEDIENRVRIDSERYDLLGRLIQRKDALEQEWLYTYNDRGLLESITNPDTTSVAYLYTSQGFVEYETITATDGKTRQTYYLRDKLGRVEAVTYPHNLVISHDYNDLDQVVNTYRNGIWFSQNAYDDLGRLRQRTTADALFERWTYDNNSQIETYKDQIGASWSFDNDAFGQAEFITDPYTNLISNGFDKLGRKLSSTDQLDHTQRVELNDAGQVEFIFDAYDKKIAQYKYDTSGRMAEQFDAFGNKTTYVYNGFNELILVTDSLAASTSFSYDALGRRDGLVDANDEPQSWAYNYRNQTTSHVNALNKTFTQVYDDFGNLDYVEQQSDVFSSIPVKTDYLFDNGNRLREVINANGHARSYHYDAFDRLEQVIDEDNKSTFYAYNARDMVNSVQDGSRSPYISYQYTGLNQVKERKFKDHDGIWQTDEYRYNKFGQLEFFDSANGYSETHQYDEAGRLDYVTNHTLGQTLDYTFDDNNRQTFLSDSFDGTGTVYTRDDAGRIEAIDYNGEVTTLLRDEFGRVYARELPNGTRDIVVFDALGRITATLTQVEQDKREIHNNVDFLGYEPSPLLRVNNGKQVSNYLSEELHQALSDAVDTQIIRANEASDLDLVYEIQTYSLNFLDANGNVIAKLSNGNWTLFDYDFGLSQVLKEWRINSHFTEFGWDKVGNLLNKSHFDHTQDRGYVYSNSNKLLTSGKDGNNFGLATYDYDDYGNLSTVNSQQPWAQPNSNYQYDALGRMTLHEADNNGNLEVSNYSYDALERRVYSSGYRNSSGTVTANSAWAFASLYDGRQERAQWTPDSRTRNGTWEENENQIIDQQWNNLQAFKQLNYVPNAVAGMYGQLISQDLFAPDLPEFSNLNNEFGISSSREKLYYHQDRQNSTTLISGNDGKGILDYIYDASGVVYAAPAGNWNTNHTDSQWNSGLLNPYTYTGKYTDAQTKMVHMDARWYNSKQGRFVQPDYYNFAQLGLPNQNQHRLVNQLGLNTSGLLIDPSQQMRYGYVGGNAISWTDPSGLCVYGLVGCGGKSQSDVVDELGRIDISHDVKTGAGFITNVGIELANSTKDLVNLGMKYSPSSPVYGYKDDFFDVPDIPMIGEHDEVYVQSVKNSALAIEVATVVKGVVSLVKALPKMYDNVLAYCAKHKDSGTASADDVNYSPVEVSNDLDDLVTIDKHGILKNNKEIPGQSHHLNQNAAFKSVIPENEAVAVKLEGNAFTEIDSPHYNAHESLESFWQQYRRGGDLHPSVPTNKEYTLGLHQSLLDSGMSDKNAWLATKAAIQQRVQYGLKGRDLVPRVPFRMGQKRR